MVPDTQPMTHPAKIKRKVCRLSGLVAATIPATAAKTTPTPMLYAQ
jgi:hypothetical protein